MFIKIMSICLMAAALFAVSTVSLAAQVPHIINYQGKIAVGSTPFTGTGLFKFALVQGTGATSYWSNDGTSTAGSEPATAVSLPVVNGLYVVPLGDTAVASMPPITPVVFDNTDVRLRVWFNDGSTGSQLLSPDQQIASVGYAMVAASVADGSITAAKIAPGAVGEAQLTPGITITGNLNGNATSADTAALQAAQLAAIASPGTLNSGGNPVDWTKLKGVPAAFADGVDNGILSITTGSGLTGGTITSSGVISLGSDVPRLFNSNNNFSGWIAAAGFAGNGSGLVGLSGTQLQNGSVPLNALDVAARPKFDRQMAYNPQISSFPISVFTDLPGMSLTTKNLNETGNYIIEFKTTVNSNATMEVAGFRFVINGSVIDASSAYVHPIAGRNVVASTRYMATGLSAGTVIKVQGYNQTSVGLYFSMLTIDGVASSQVVP